jgi:serine/threonine protein kinase
MGDVYKAFDSRLHRQVALKVLNARLADDPASRERFEREARTISSLDHPHICTLHDVGREDGVDFLVMQYLEGETLAARLRRGALPFDHGLRCALEIASALDRAHRNGIVHRDLKPGNIMLTKTGAILLDFGVAKLVNATVFGSETIAAVTEAGSIVGTLQYMAPEQLEGKAADARTDIFAFGAVLYEMLTGVTAFAGGSSPEIISSIMKSEPPAVATRQPLAPPGLDRVIRTCLAKDPDDRFDTAHDLLLQLTWIVEGSAASKPPAAGRGRTRERWAWFAALVLTTALALFAGIRSWTGQAADGAEVRLQIITPPSAMPTSIALSPARPPARPRRSSGYGRWTRWQARRCPGPRTHRSRSGRPTAAGWVSSPTRN